MNSYSQSSQLLLVGFLGWASEVDRALEAMRSDSMFGSARLALYSMISS